MKKVGAMCRGGVHTGSLYLNDTWITEGVPNLSIHAKQNLDLLESVAFTLSTIKGPWIIGADWNCTPEELRATNWLTKVGAVICAPKAATCNG